MPKLDAIARVTEAFAKAPVTNPDGKPGIVLHVDCGQNCIMNPLTGETWGNYSNAHSLLHSMYLGTNPPSGYAWMQFDQFKTANFSNHPARASVFHYVIFAHDLPFLNKYFQPRGDSGISRFGLLSNGEGGVSSDFIVSLGEYEGHVGTAQRQAGTFMHELGHNLGLHHGGSDDVRFKPNYLSVMNYLFQFSGLNVNGGPLLDYSQFAIPSLDPNHLDESVGLNGGTDLTGYGTSYYCPGGDPINKIGRKNVANANGPIDWNCNNVIEKDVQTDIGARDLNGNPFLGALFGANDWNHLIFTGGAIGAFGAAVLPATTPDQHEATPSMIPQQQLEVAVDSPGVAQVPPSIGLNLTFTVTNLGLQDDTYSLEATSTVSWSTLTDVPSTLPLSAGTSAQINVPVTVTGCPAAGTEGHFTIMATSMTNSLVRDSGDAVLIASSIPGSIVVPSVVGQTQAAAQAAIVNAGLVVGTVVTQPSTSVPAGIVISQVPASCTSVAPGSSVVLTVSSGAVLTAVPNVVGQIQGAATSAITGAGLTVGTITTMASATVPAGSVISQDPMAGTSVPAGSSVSLVVSSGSTALIAVPNVVGQTRGAATSAINVARLTVGKITLMASATVPAGSVISQDPAAGTSVPPGSPISLVVSSGSTALIAVPNVVGQIQGAAIAALNVAGLTGGEITLIASSPVPAGSVISQDPTAGTSVAPGSSISLGVSYGPVMGTAVPNVLGQPKIDAVATIHGAGLTVVQSDMERGSLTVPEGSVISQDPMAGISVPAGSSVSLVVSVGPRLSEVPNVVGQWQALARTKVVGVNGFLDISVTRQSSATVPDGVVISQDPAAGSSVLEGSTVNLVVSSGAALIAAVPDVVGLHKGIAEGAIFGAGFAIGSVTRQSSDTVSADYVISQDPAGGASVAWDSSVSLVFSSGPPVMIDVPDVVGETQAAATTALDAAGLGTAMTTLASDTVPAGNVISQDPKAGKTLLAMDAPVNLVVSSGALVVPNYRYFSQFGELGFGIGNGEFLFTGPIAIDPNSHNIVVGDGYARLQIFNSTGSYQSYFGGNGIGDELFGSIGGVAIDPISHNIVVADAANNRLKIFNSAGVYQSQFGGPGSGNGQFAFYTNPFGVAIDPASENIVVADWGNNRVQIFNSAGVYQSQFGGPGVGNGQFYEPAAIAIDPTSHNIIVGATGTAAQDLPAHFIQIFNSVGVYQSRFGGPGSGNGQITVPGFAGPSGIAIDPSSHDILVADSSNARVEIFATGGPTRTTLAASSNPSTLGQSVTFTATVTGSNPTGTVQYMDGSNSLAAPVGLSGGAATLTISILSVGTHLITAIYSGDSSNAPSASPIVNEVVQSSGPVAALSPPSVAFANTTIGTTSAAQTITLSNTGDAVLNITGITITGTNPTNFSETTTCGNTLAASANCLITVTFTPAAAVGYSAAISVADNVTGSPQAVALSGAGVSAAGAQAVLSPATILFLNTMTGMTSEAETIKLSNTGNAMLNIGGIAITGTNPAAFSQTNNCGSTLAASANCLIAVTFTPAAALSYSAGVSVADNATGSPQTVALAGTGVPPAMPQAVLSPSNVSFPNTAIGTTSAAQTITLSNTGNMVLKIAGLGITGTNLAAFSQSTSCGSRLAAAESCSIDVRFTPAAALSYSAGVSVADNATGSPHTEVISGNGIDFGVSSTTSQQTVTRGGTAQFTIVITPSNGGFNIPVTLSAKGLPPGASVSFTPVSLTPGDSAAYSTMSVQTVTAFARMPQPVSAARGLAWWPIVFTSLAVAFFWVSSPRAHPQKVARGLMMATFVLASFGVWTLYMTGCGGGFSKGEFAPPTSYVITVTGASGADQHSTTVNLTMQ
jgi:beta-lactam-binding protein with PASTA domain